MLNALDLIAKERTRQVEAKGFTHVHDDEHDHGEIAQAASEFAAPYSIGLAPDSWAYWRDNHTRMEQLAIAGALIVAEMERLDRRERLEAGE